MIDGLDDVDALLVYADLLQQQGDPHGELIVLQHRGLAIEAGALLDAHAPALLGTAHRLWSLGMIELTWERGFIAGVRLRPMDPRAAFDAVAVARMVLAQPLARFVTTLTIEAAALSLDDHMLHQALDDLPCTLELGPSRDATMTLELLAAPDPSVIRGLVDNRFTLPDNQPTFIGRSAACQIVCPFGAMPGHRTARIERGVRGWVLRHNGHGTPPVVNERHTVDEQVLCDGDRFALIPGLVFQVHARD
ncbi:MAG: hypothetical protein ABI867_37650 [Kofleriaceae bacterium]